MMRLFGAGAAGESNQDKDRFEAELEGALHVKEQEVIIAQVLLT